MDKRISVEVRQPSRTERSHSSRVESPRRNLDLTRDQAKKMELIERGQSKMQKYQQEAERCQDNDIDTFEYFKKTLDNDIHDSENHVITVKSKNWYGNFFNGIDMKNGKIIGIENRYIYNKKLRKEIKLNFSDIIFNQLLLSMEHANKEISQFDLKCWYGQNIVNKDTRKTVKLFFPEAIGEDGLQRLLKRLRRHVWCCFSHQEASTLPQTAGVKEGKKVSSHKSEADPLVNPEPKRHDESSSATSPQNSEMIRKKKFLAGTDEFIALAGTETAQSKFFLLAQHPKAFKDKKVKSITVIRQVHSIIDINYEFGS